MGTPIEAFVTYTNATVDEIIDVNPALITASGNYSMVYAGYLIDVDPPVPVYTNITIFVYDCSLIPITRLTSYQMYYYFNIGSKTATISLPLWTKSSQYNCGSFEYANKLFDNITNTSVALPSFITYNYLNNRLNVTTSNFSLTNQMFPLQNIAYLKDYPTN